MLAVDSTHPRSNIQKPVKTDCRDPSAAQTQLEGSPHVAMWGRTSCTQEIDTAHVTNPVAGMLLAVGGTHPCSNPQMKLISMNLGLGSRRTRERRTCSLAEHCCISHVCLGSRRASRKRLNGQNPAAESGLCRQLYRLEPSIVLFKKNDPKPPKNAH